MPSWHATSTRKFRLPATPWLAAQESNSTFWSEMEDIKELLSNSLKWIFHTNTDRFTKFTKYTSNWYKKTEGCEHVTGWTCKHEDLNQLCPKISPITEARERWVHIAPSTRSSQYKSLEDNDFGNGNQWWVDLQGWAPRDETPSDYICIWKFSKILCDCKVVSAWVTAWTRWWAHQHFLFHLVRSGIK
jgi:hypothetical protein